jgi:hypothetical protein
MTRIDRELLELAAKAAGIDEGIGGAFWTECGIFDPLTDDGDALRLAVKLDLAIETNFWDNDGCFYTDKVFVSSIESVEEEARNNDPYAATRRAIVRAAAEIGRNMK